MCAAKQFLDKLNIKNREFLTLGKDFNILRIHYGRTKKNIFYRLAKKFYNIVFN